MTDDTNWLKKNPVGHQFRMSLRRSSRFYPQDMDGSIMNEENTKNQVLVVSHMPRRSNLPIDKIKEMNFKIPAPLQKSGIKRPVTRVTKYPAGQQPVSRSSSCFRADPQIENFLKSRARKSSFRRPNVGNSNVMNDPRTKVMSQRAAPMPQECVGSAVRDPADISILSPSRVVIQSTPRETSAIRSILKQKENSQRLIIGDTLNSKKLKAAKRVNFNGDTKGRSNETEMEGTSATREESLTSELATVMPSADTSQAIKNKDILGETDDESTAAFSNFFKPISYEEVGRKIREEAVKEKIDKRICDETEGDEGGVENTEVKTECSGKSKSNDSSCVISNIMDLWKVYGSEVNDIRRRLRVLEQSFENSLKFVLDENVKDEFSVYQTEKGRLYEKLQCLELEFNDSVKNNVNIKSLFSNYLEKKELILREQSELEDNFGRILGTTTEKYLKKAPVINNNDAECEINGGVPLAKRNILSPKCGSVNKVSNEKRKSGSVISSQMKTLTGKGNSSMKKASSDGNTPDNTPARRMKLSRKVEKQIKALFEE